MILGTVCFLAAGAVLVIYGHGPLVWPGVIASVVGAIFCILKKHVPAMLLGVLTAALSMAAQALYGVCLSCLLAASFFAAAGLLCSVSLAGRRPGAVLAAMLVLFSAALLLEASLNNLRVPPTGNSEKAAAEIIETGEANSKPAALKLYFSPWCGNCAETVSLFVERDREGKEWTPVVVPAYALEEGKRYLKERGYTGVVFSAGASPGGGVPCLELKNGNLLLGSRKIEKWLSEEGGF